jgi:hypothetical protein
MIFKKSKKVMDTVTVTIDVSRPSGRKLIQELQKKKVVKIESIPVSQMKGVSSVTTEELFKRAEDYLNNYYGTSYTL